MAAPPADTPIVLTSGPVSRQLTLPESPQAGDRYALRVAGITVAPGNPALFRVFVDLPKADRYTQDSDHLVGQVSILAGPSKAARNVIMPLSWPRKRKLSPGAKLEFTLVPLADYTASPIRVQKLEITVSRS